MGTAQHDPPRSQASRDAPGHAGTRLSSRHSSAGQCWPHTAFPEASPPCSPPSPAHGPLPNCRHTYPTLASPGQRRHNLAGGGALEETLGTPEARHTAQRPLTVAVYTSLVYPSGSENGLPPGGAESRPLPPGHTQAVRSGRPPSTASPAASAAPGSTATPQGAAKCLLPAGDPGTRFPGKMQMS